MKHNYTDSNITNVRFNVNKNEITLEVNDIYAIEPSSIAEIYRHAFELGIKSNIIKCLSNKTRCLICSYRGLTKAELSLWENGFIKLYQDSNIYALFSEYLHGSTPDLTIISKDEIDVAVEFDISVKAMLFRIMNSDKPVLFGAKTLNALYMRADELGCDENYGLL